MKMLSLLAVVLSLGLTLSTGDAEAAKRFGGGKSAGMQRQMDTPKAPTAAPATNPGAAAASAKAPAAGAAAPAAQPKRSWMGPLAGLAAGLGLAALASHFGFGEELASMLMIALAVFAVIAVIGFVMRRRAAAKQPASAMQYAGTGAGDSPRPYEVAMPAAGAAGGSPAAAAAPTGNIPADFDVAGFVRTAKVNFIRLQAANDAGNLDDIREFTTPEMFAELKMNIAERGTAAQETDVVAIEAQVLEVAEEESRYIVSVRFNGSLREERNGPLETVDEVWHLVKPREGRGGWLLAGIQQLQ